jgi:type VI secretion system (T6SS) VasI/EvfG family protein
MFAVRATVPWMAALLFAEASSYADEIPNLSRVIDCKLIKDEAERLRCYDRVLNEAPANAPRATPPVDDSHFVRGSWVVSLGKSPTDDAPQLVAALEALGGKGALVFRCQQGRTDAYVTLQAYVGAAQPLPVSYTINNGQEIATRWLPAKDGNALFVPTAALAIEFIRSLPPEATLALTIHDFVGRGELFQFKLGPISDLRDKMADVCGWPVQQQELQQPQVVQQAKPQPNSATSKLAYVPISQHKWNVLVRHPHRQN